ncbi:DNA cytosine methyltransferase [Clostridium sp. LP20]|uniref:DNA cytosine methyltransferase n=1 Tax=Clostridium sp. LP20 TaxID=3418665 RepID=UPI003EE53062
MNNKYLFPSNKIGDLLLPETITSVIELLRIDDNEKIGLDEANIAILEKKVKYTFSKINNRTNTKEFCSNRDIKNNGLNIIDLFCGAGGSSSGFRLAGCNIVGAMDINPAAVATHDLNFRNCKTVLGDIALVTPEQFAEKINYQTIDILIGSPPCQTFSSLSQGKIRSLGKDISKDIRNYYYKNYLDYLSYFKPKAFLMENVPGFMTKYKGELFKDLLKYLKDNHPEYEVKYEVLDASDFSVPQSRKRLFICGYLKKLDFSFPIANNEFVENNLNKVTVENAISDLPHISDDWRLDRMPYKEFDNLTKYQKFMRVNQELVCNNICRVSNSMAKKMFDKLKPGQRYIQLTDEEKSEIELFDSFASSVIKGRCRKLPTDDIAWTVIAHIGMDGYEYIHPTECRTLSVREAARLQSFTDDFVFVGNMREQYVQIGNAVPPLLSYAIAKELCKCVLNNKNEKARHSL